jgi:hypothetical protein
MLLKCQITFHFLLKGLVWRDVTLNNLKKQYLLGSDKIAIEEENLKKSNVETPMSKHPPNKFRD